MTENRVEVLCPGTIRRNGPIVLEARSSATLISCGNRYVLVDTSGPENRETLLQALNDRGIAPEQIESVVLTHLHRDHDGNLELFPMAKVYVHKLEMPRKGFEKIDQDLELCPGVMVTATPGHTRGSMSVLVKAESDVAIVGDAIPTEDNVRKWAPPGVHYDRKVALASMKRLISMADVIVPGHGPSFSTAVYRTKEGEMDERT